MRKRTALEIEAAQDPTTGTVSTVLFRGYNGMIRGSVADGTSPELVGKRGRIWLFDEERIAVWWSGWGWFERASEALAEVEGATIFSRGDKEGTLILPNSAIETAVRLIQARKRRTGRVLTEEEKTALANRGRQSLLLLRQRQNEEIQDFKEGVTRNTALLSQAAK